MIKNTLSFFSKILNDLMTNDFHDFLTTWSQATILRTSWRNESFSQVRARGVRSAVRQKQSVSVG